eukprot:COSAG01_NODE_45169_length_411_cov_1596.435897_1_plen_48_part_01
MTYVAWAQSWWLSWTAVSQIGIKITRKSAKLYAKLQVCDVMRADLLTA